MGYDAKYGKVTTEHGEIPDDEPVVILRGQDLAVPRTLNYYRGVARELGSPDEHLSLVTDQVGYIKGWQRYHPDRVKVPDTRAQSDGEG